MIRRSGSTACAVLAILAACSTTRQTPLEPRYVAVHNALAAMGLTQTGPIHQASLAEGRDARFAIELPAACTTVMAIGGPGVRDLDVELLDSDDKALAHDFTHDTEAALRACPEKGGRFTIHVKMARGAGDFIAATWTGSGLPTAASSTPLLSAGLAGNGTCDAPLPLGAGSFSGTTRRGDAEQTGTCGNSESREIVYKLDLPRRQRVTIEVDPTFDSILYLRKDDCTDKDAEVACNDDVSPGNSKRGATGTRGSRIDEVLDPATYWVFVDGYNNDAGSYRLNVHIADVPSLADACQKARPLMSKTTGMLAGAFNHANGSCDLGKGPDALHRLDIPQRARARVVLHSDEFNPVIHARRSCTDDQTEVACTDGGFTTEDATLVNVLDPGSYTLFADSNDKVARGRYTIEAALAPESGTGVRGDSCGDALPFALGDKVDGDTFDAKDDLAGKCGGSGTPDVAYRFDVARRSRVIGRFLAQEGEHVFVLARTCTDRTTEIACGPSFDEVLAPGTYSLAIDGSDKAPFGRFTFQLKSKDVSAQENACRAVPSLTLGKTITGTTAGAGDRFVESCAGREDLQGSSDRVYKLTLAARTQVELLLSTPGHDGVLAIRKSCVDPPQMKAVRTAEAACNNDGPDNRHSKIDTMLEAGTYWVVVDGHQGKNEGAFTLEAKVSSSARPRPNP